MKSKTNLFLLISFLLALTITAWVYYQSTHKIGEIDANDKTDKNFRVCNEDKIPEYYSMKTDFIGGKSAIKDSILYKLESLKFRESRLVTFRFIVNCEGQAGRFRVKAINRDIKKSEVDPENIQKIEKVLAQLKSWNPARNKSGQYFDSYYMVNFKIEDHKIVDIF